MINTKSEYIINKLCFNNFETYIVGGAVRDFLLGINPKDEDIVTSASSSEIISLFKDKHKIKTVGRLFNIILIDDIEVATFRTDKYFGLSDKNVKIKITNSIKEDLSRRDLTINSQAFCQYTGDIIDPYHGQKDLKNRIIRFVGNPEKRIFEDPNRIIRACRFLALINGKFHKDTKKALINFAHLIPDFISPERINIEIMKTMASIQKSSLFFDALSQIGALEYIFESLDNCYAYESHGPHHGETIIEHCYMCGDKLSIKKPLLKLAGYLHDVGKPSACVWNPKTKDLKFKAHSHLGADCVKKELINLKFSNKEILYITSLIDLHMRSFKTPKAIRRTLKVLNDYNIKWKDLYQLRIADRLSNLKKDKYELKNTIKEQILKIRFEINRKAPCKFEDLNINGNDIMRITKLKPCEEVGIIKNYLLNLTIDNPNLNSKEKLEDLTYKYFYEFKFCSLKKNIEENNYELCEKTIQERPANNPTNSSG